METNLGDMKRPNFFIIGAPKCGTTALSSYLEGNPKVGFSSSKEPHYFCTDYPQHRFASSEQEYLNRYFGSCNGQHTAVGEASVWYLYSKHAVNNILNFEPNAKFIVMLRNPVDMIYSLHSQLVYNLYEDVTDFASAWRLRNTRALNQCIPSRAREPSFLLYDHVGRLGDQLERTLRLIDPRQIQIILFDELVVNAVQVYKDVLQFLGVEYDDRDDFAQINANKSCKSTLGRRLVKEPPFGLMKAADRLKRGLGVYSLGIGRGFIWLENKLNAVERPRQPMPAGLREELVIEFREDVRKLERLTRKNLSAWYA